MTPQAPSVDGVPKAEAPGADESRFESLAQNLAEGLMIADLDGRIAYANPRFVEMSGYGVDELVGLRTFDLVASDDDRERQKARLLERAAGRSEVYEIRMKCKDGTWRWIEVHASPFRDATGRVVGAQAAFSDVTSRRQAEERVGLLESAMEHATDAVMICTSADRRISERDGSEREVDGPRVVYVNPAFTRMSGYSRDEIVGRSPFVLHGAPGRSSQEPLGGLHCGQAASGEMTACRKDGSSFLLEWRVAPIQREAREVCHLVAILRDITEERRLEDQLRQSQKMEAMGRLAGGVAHDFNNLLTAILGYNEILLSRLTSSDPNFKAADEIGKATRRAAALTRQLLAFGRRQVLEPRTLDLNEAVAGIEEMLRRLIGEHITLVTRLGDEAAWVEADPSQLEQVILNLALNARDAMSAGGRLVLESGNAGLAAGRARELGADPGSYVRLRVEDTGEGMDRETLARVFEPFFTTKKKGEGTGLGLATVYGIVRQSGGVVQVSSEPGRGTVFEVYLPRAANAFLEQPERRATKVRDGHEGVLVAEDDEMVRTLVAEVLADKGYRVLEAKDGRQALEVAEASRQPVDLLITDVVMPDMRGPELEQRLAEAHPGLATLFISGYAHGVIPDLREPGSEAPFLEKPFSPAALVRKVREVLDRRGGSVIGEERRAEAG